MLNYSPKFKSQNKFLRYLALYFRSSKYVLKQSTVSFITVAGLIGGLSFLFKSKRSVGYEAENDHLSLQEVKPRLENSGPPYIEAPKIHNLISLPRFQHALMRIKYASKHKSRQSYQKAIEELVKLSVGSGSFIKSNENGNGHGFLSDGLANYVAQFLDEEFQLEMAIRAPQVDHRFFRLEPPSTVQKLIKTCPSYSDQQSTLSYPSNIFEDIEYALIFKFLNKIIPKIRNAPFSSDKNIDALLTRFENEVNSFVLSEYSIRDRPTLNIWSTDGLDVSLDYLDQEEKQLDSKIASENLIKTNNLKQKLKSEFIRRNETAILKILEKMAQTDRSEFVAVDGLETLLLLFEKHKFDEAFLKTICNCLCLVSEETRYRKLFVHSGWLRRLNQMCKPDFYVPDKATPHNNIDLIAELNAHKILLNLSRNEEKEPIVYSTMVFPLFPLYVDSLKQKKHLLQREQSGSEDEAHEHIVDVVFVHGLRGSLFKTWRQDENSMPKTEPQIENNNLRDLENKILDKLNSLIETNQEKEFSYCWPKDWLPLDLKQANQLENINEIDRMRLIGVNYDSIYSLWGEDEVDDKMLKNSIKERAMDLMEQLKKAHVGARSVVWVCHSMGGLIVKQMLVHLEENAKKLKGDGLDLINNTKAIVFLSTPHLGSSIAKTATKFSFAVSLSAEVFDLSLNSNYLLDLNKNFLKLAKNEADIAKSIGHKKNDDEESTKFKILSLCENLPTYIGLKMSTKTVSKESAEIGVGEFYLMNDRDHLNICKPENRQSFVYKKILDLINQQMKSESSTCEKCIEFNSRKTMNDYYFEFFKSPIFKIFSNF